MDLTLPLTEHELAILTLISHGHTNGQIGRTLGYAADTIKQHSVRIHRKLNARNRVHAVRRGFEHGILTPGT
jgi:DNA-binding NarL/FixJ family response regulator